MKLSQVMLILSISPFVVSAFAKLPAAPPADPVAVAAKAEKDKAAAVKTKAQQVGAEDKAVKSFQANMKKAGKPIPKPTPVVVAAAPPPAAPSKAAASVASPATDKTAAGKK